MVSPWLQGATQGLHEPLQTPISAALNGGNVLTSRSRNCQQGWSINLLEKHEVAHIYTGDGLKLCDDDNVGHVVGQSLFPVPHAGFHSPGEPLVPPTLKLEMPRRALERSSSADRSKVHTGQWDVIYTRLKSCGRPKGTFANCHPQSSSRPLPSNQP